MNNRFFTPFVCLGAILVIFFFCGVVLADEGNPDETEQTVGSRPEAESFELDAIVVTAGKRKDAVSDIPAHVTVITSEDISAYAGTGITELLAQESGITVRSLFGNDKQAVLDLRGMGDTAASNVIIMVDGLVLNSPDQSGASLSSVPLEQIERIEIVRGAAPWFTVAVRLAALLILSPKNQTGRHPLKFTAPMELTIRLKTGFPLTQVSGM